MPGYEAVGRVAASESGDLPAGARVFVPGASCYRDVRGLFGASAARLVVPARRAVPVGDLDAEEATLLALAATAQHALAGGAPPDLVVGHGALGRLLRAFRQQGDRVLHRVFRDHQHLVHLLADDLQRHLAHVAYGDALGDGGAAH